MGEVVERNLPLPPTSPLISHTKKMLTRNFTVHQAGFTLIEIMLVVAILGILVSIAAPQYLGYINQAKQEACIRNTQIAQNVIKEEIAKLQNVGNRRQDILTILNKGNKKNPFTGQGFAFITNGTQEKCQILIANLSNNKIPATGQTVTINGYQKDPDNTSQLIKYQIPALVE